MKIATPEEVKDAEKSLISSGVSAEVLMEQAGIAIAQHLIREFPSRHYYVAYLGKGNNAGDALVVLRELLRHNPSTRVAYRLAYNDKVNWSPLLKKKWQELLSVVGESFQEFEGEIPNFFNNGGGQPYKGILIDALVGLGGKGELRSPCAELADEMNEFRESDDFITVSIDYPSGLDGETGRWSESTVIADVSYSIGAIKSGMVADQATGHVGRIVPIPLSAMYVGRYDEMVIDADFIKPALSKRPYEWYKKSAGCVSIVAGSRGYLGAARLCAEACHRMGAGMVSLFVPQDIYPFLATSMTPEIMVKPVQSYQEVRAIPADVLLVGPGLGQDLEWCEDALLEMIQNFSGKILLDADALNLIARKKAYSLLSERTLITPHVGEMERLCPRQKEETRKQWSQRFCERIPCALLLKGARSLVNQNRGAVMYNTTGSSAMANAGQGDVLSGVCAALMAQGLSPAIAGAFGAWYCGYLSDYAHHVLSQRVTTASQISSMISSFL